MSEGGRKLHNEELHNLYYSPTIIRMIKPRRMRRTRNVACIPADSNANKVLVKEARINAPLRRPR
jgi:hypothetical protein